MKRDSIKGMQSFCISLQANRSLSGESLKKQTGKISYNDGWTESSLKFISFDKGILTLRNTYNDRSYILQLQVKENKLLLNCSCNNDNKIICKHAYWATNEILWKYGENYFSKFSPSGMMELAFKYPMLFNKQESNVGIDVSPRAELKSIYHLGPTIQTPDIKAIMTFPETNLKSSHVFPEINYEAPNLPNEKALAYLLLISFRHEHLPSVTPIIGKLTVKGNAIKEFDSFLSALYQTDKHLLSAQQRILHEQCLQLYKQTEKISGELLEDNSFIKHRATLIAMFNLWTDIYPLLLAQPFVYSYVLFGPKELRTKPRKGRWQQIFLSPVTPVISFILVDKGDYYRFLLHVHVEGKLLEDIRTDLPFFIMQEDFIFRLGSLRDACLIEWVDRSGGWITIFKEHFDLFEKEVLAPLRSCYTVTLVKQ